MHSLAYTFYVDTCGHFTKTKGCFNTELLG